MSYEFGAWSSWPEWIEPVLGLIILIGMGLFAYMSAHLVAERKAGKQIPMFWEKITKKKEKEMGYGKGYPKKAKKPAKKAKKPARKPKNTKRY